MASLYQRAVSPNTASPAMLVAASQGAAGGIPRGGSVSMPQQDQGINAAQLGGLLGMIKNGSAGGSGAGVFNESVMPGVGQSLALGGAASAPSAGVLGAGIPSEGMGLSFDPSKLANLFGSMSFGA